MNATQLTALQRALNGPLALSYRSAMTERQLCNFAHCLASEGRADDWLIAEALEVGVSDVRRWLGDQSVSFP